MRFGISLPVSGPNTSEPKLVEMAQAAEAAGFDTVGVLDRIVIPREITSWFPSSPTGVYSTPPETRIYEALISLAYVAAKTSRVKLVPSVLVLPLPNPVLTAKQIATLDDLSGGRVIVGVGAGWMQEENRALNGQTFEDRGALVDEYLEIMLRLWSAAETDTSYQGRFYSVGNLGFSPKPVQQPHPPIWIGGNGRAAVRRAAKYGDAWNPSGASAEEIAVLKPFLDQQVQEAGRPAGAVALGVRASLRVTAGGLESERRPNEAPGRVFVGTAREVLEQIQPLEKQGVREILFALSGSYEEGQQTVQRFGDVLGAVAR